MADLLYTEIGTNLHARVENIPTALSGAQVLGLIDEARICAKEFTGTDPGSPTISERFVPAVTMLVQADLLDSMQTFGADLKSAKLGEFSVEKGAQSNLDVVSQSMKNKAMDKLRLLGRRAIVSRVIGGS